MKHTLTDAMVGNASDGFKIGLSLFRDGANRRPSEIATHFPDIRQEQYQPAPRLTRLAVIRDLFELPLTSVERAYVSQLADIARRYDAVLWFGSPYDPVTHRISDLVKCPVFYHVNDSIILHEERRKGLTRPLRRAIAARVELKTLRQAAFSAVVYVGAADAQQARVLLRRSEQHTRVVHIPLGVDTAFFRPRPRKPAARKTVLFAGSMCYGPNIDAAKRLVHDIIPLLRGRPLVRIVGHSPTKEVRALADSADGVVVTGRVADISIEYANADLLVAPLAQGAGMQFKVLDALASGIPVVTSPVVAEGIGMQLPGLLVCQNATDYAPMIDHLLESDQIRQSLGAAGRAYVEECLTWTVRSRRLRELIGEALVNSRSQPKT